MVEKRIEEAFERAEELMEAVITSDQRKLVLAGLREEIELILECDRKEGTILSLPIKF